jgi:TolB-like protein/Flp pilus assembly protein TadD
MSVSAGTRLGPYEVVSPLGAGGMGEVYRARHVKLGRDVAIKVLPADVAGSPERRRRFEREARAASALNHPNIVTIHDIDEHDGVHYIAMELVEGHTLRQLLAKGPLPPERVVAVARQMAEGLARAHAAGVVHRDLKPENVMVAGDGLVKILDFGLAKLAPARLETGLSEATTVEQPTHDGLVIGTIPYMSPEQAAGRPVDFRSDQFSFGSILYEMAAGRGPFARETAAQTLAAIIEGAPEPLGRLNPSIPPTLVAIAERCLTKDPARRFAMTDELASALRAVPDAPAHRSRRAALWVAAGLVAASLALALAAGVRQRWRPPSLVTSVPAIRAVAVLPLRNLSGDPQQQYFADGITEALITDLSKIRALKIISRSSVMRYRGTKAPVSEIARQLGVDAVIEGSAQRAGDRVRITAELIEASSDRVLWGESYERAFADALRLEGELAQAVAQGVGTTVTLEERKRLSGRPAIAPEALEAYLKGVFRLQRFTPQDLDAALRFFQQALQMEPGYAAAQVGIAQVWSFRMQGGLVAPREAGPRGLAAVEKALSIDPDLSEAHMALAGLRAWFEWKWDVGDAEYRRAIELNPSNAQARAFHSHLLTLLGRFTQGTEEMDRALRLDPVNPFVQVLSAIQLILVGRFEDGITRIQATFAGTPGFGIGHIPLWAALDHQGHYEEALRALKDYYAVEQNAPEVVEAIEHGRQAGGYREALRRAAKALEMRARSTSVGAVNVASLYDQAGDREKAIQWLETAYDAHDPNLGYVSVVPFTPGLVRDSRFQDLLRRLGLEDRHSGPASGFVREEDPEQGVRRPGRAHPGRAADARGHAGQLGHPLRRPAVLPDEHARVVGRDRAGAAALVLDVVHDRVRCAGRNGRGGDRAAAENGSKLDSRTRPSEKVQSAAARMVAGRSGEGLFRWRRTTPRRIAGHGLRTCRLSAPDALAKAYRGARGADASKSA